MAAPKLDVEPAALDFGPAVLGVVSRARIALINSGNAPLAVPAVALGTGDPDFIILHDECDESIAPGARCDVRIQLFPTVLGGRSGTLELQSAAGNAEVPLAGFGVASGSLTLAPAAGSAQDFGGLLLQSTREASFDVSNPTANASGPLNFSINQDQFQVLAPREGDCSSTTNLVNGQSCRIHVAFAPQRRGLVDASLVVTSQSTGAVALPLSGEGQLPGQLALAPDSVDFGSVVVTGVARRTLHVQNGGDQPLVLGELSLSPAPSSVAGGDQAPSPFSLLESDCGAGKSLVAGARCDVQLAFRPSVAGTSQTSQLVVTTADGLQRTVALSGAGVELGALVLAPAANGSADFGDLVIDSSSTESFVATNPSAQPSGPLDIHSTDDFVVLPASADGDCNPGQTSLVNGQSCAINVSLTPTDRGPRNGLLTVGSSLAGTAQLALVGRGLSAPNLDIAQREVDFGRIATETQASRVVTVRNLGDQPVSSLRATLLAPDGTNSKDFSFDSACTTSLAPNTSCDLTVQFQPQSAAPRSAVLSVASDEGGTASTLLLGDAFAHGSLQLTPGAGASSDFGDAVLGTPRTQPFTLSNPASVPSGHLTITSTDKRFSVDEGDCNPAGGSGLVNGQSCTFNVTFTPVNSDAVTANLSVQSPGAGETALALTGRGRTAASLSATGNRDFGISTIGQGAAPQASNRFTWTVTNDGDEATGTLQLQNSAASEFVVSNDTCSNATVQGHQTCQMDVSFSVVMTGSRSGTLTLTDASRGQSLTLAMTGTGVQIAAPGQSCVSATCSIGVCTRGVCCDRACAGSCQVCSNAGVCGDQSSRETCGNGSGQCFGVNLCLLPEKQPCTGDNQCGSGHCQPRLGGQAATDQICCLEACAAGQVCSPDTGHCQAPTLNQGAACGSPGALACGSGLTCKACLNGGNACTPNSDCCGGCAGEQTCDTTTGTCQCPLQANGLRQVSCGGGRCIINRANACCDTASGCKGQDQCNPTDDLCECPAGTRECAAGSNICVPNAQCCNCTGPCQSCNNGTCSAVAANQPGTCSGSMVCSANGQCVAPNPAALATVTGGAPAAFDRTLVNNVAGSPRTWTVQNTGASATAALRLTNTDDAEFQVTGNCIGLVLQPTASCSLSISFAPRNAGNRTATLTLNGGQSINVSTTVQGLAKIRDGSPCSANNADCDSARCTEWLIDADGDGVGAPQAISGFPSLRICGDASAANHPAPLIAPGKGCQGTDATLQYVAPQAFNDCCDTLDCSRGPLAAGFFTPETAFPGQTQPQAGAALCNGNTMTSDFNCDGEAIPMDAVHLGCGDAPAPTNVADCTARAGFQSPLVCGQNALFISCNFQNGACIATNSFSRPPSCL